MKIRKRRIAQPLCFGFRTFVECLRALCVNPKLTKMRQKFINPIPDYLRSFAFAGHRLILE